MYETRAMVPIFLVLVHEDCICMHIRNNLDNSNVLMYMQTYGRFFRNTVKHDFTGQPNCGFGTVCDGVPRVLYVHQPDGDVCDESRHQIHHVVPDTNVW